MIIRKQHFFAILAVVCVLSGLSFSMRVSTSNCFATAEQPVDALAKAYGAEVRPLVQKYCSRCHSAKRQEADINLDSVATYADVRKSPRTWQKVLEMLDSSQMPPRSSKQLEETERLRLRNWVRSYLKFEARANAGDPGPVVLRRLSNAEYNYTIADLTGLKDLQPTRQFPVDGAAGEGFTNTGQSLVMSPSLLTKYLDAGKEIAAHAVLLPDGIRFSPYTTRRDWTNEILDQIRQTYYQFSDSQGGTRVNLQGIVFDTNSGGRLKLQPFLTATIHERDALLAGRKSIETLSRERNLNPKYMGLLWSTLSSKNPSELLAHFRARWKTAKVEDVPGLIAEIEQWQKILTKFQSVGHMKAWMVPITPLTTRQELRFKIPPIASEKEIVFYLATGNAGDGSEKDDVVWENPRFVIPGRSDLPLKEVREFTRQIMFARNRLFGSTTKCLSAAVAVGKQNGKLDIAQLAREHDVNEADLVVWLDYLGIGSITMPKLSYFTNKLPRSGAYDFVKGWGKLETPSILANSSDKHVRIPGNMKAHGVCVHPSPTLNAAVGWRSPIDGTIRIEGKVTHAHPECGNGVTWSLILSRGAVRQVLGSGVAQGSRSVAVGPIDKVVIRKGDLVSLLIGPRNGNHSCDLTDLELVLKSSGKDGHEWSLTKDVSGDILAGNPHADRFGTKDVWHFYTEPVKEGNSPQGIPVGSLLARWLAASTPHEKQQFAEALQILLTKGPPNDAKHPDTLLFRQLTSLTGPLLAKIETKNIPVGSTPSQKSLMGVEPSLFGKHPSGQAINPTSLCVKAPSTIEVQLPADLFAGAEFVATGLLHSTTGAEGSVQLQVVTKKPEALTTLRSDLPVLVQESSQKRKQWEKAFDDFRSLFPAALCYTKIVPVDEVVTLTLYHREDENLSRLMLNETQKAHLNRLWNELHYVSHDALTLVDAYKQLMEYATQDSNPKLFEPYRKPIMDRAAAFKKSLVDTEPNHLSAVIDFAGRAYRRPLTNEEKQDLRELYRKLRAQELPHDQAIRLTLARIFIAPAFLYRLEKTPAGKSSLPVTDWELANRLSYFLWSSMPDRELLDQAAKGKLRNPDVLVAHAKRMLKDDRVRRLGVEFGCQWLHVHSFDKLDEKSERHFPTFASLRGEMYEETIQFFVDMFQRDCSVLNLLDADYTFVNDKLAKHYDIPGVTGHAWRRIDGVKKYGRGGILGLSTSLAKQSGASRTSPILRGNWVSEVLLGEKLPRPPKDVPQLPDDEANLTLSVRQLVEKHSSDPRCAVCHTRIDPFGFALEGFDAIGRKREKDLGNRKIDTRTRTKDGIAMEGIAGLRDYLLNKRRGDFLRQFCRKLLGYALGRGVQLSDEPLLDEMQERLAKDGYRFSVLVETILRSKQFREIRGKDMQPSETP